MPNLSRKRLVELVKTMLLNILEPDDLRNKQFRFQRSFSGDNSWLRIQAEDMPPIEMHADPSGNLGPAFFLVDDGFVAFEEYIHESLKDETIGKYVGKKALEKSIEALLRNYRATPNIEDKALDAAIRESLKALRASITTWQAFVPVDNLLLEGMSELRIGNVYFHPFTSIDKLLRELFLHSIDMNEHTSAEEIPKLKEVIETNIFSIYSTAPTCAELTIKGEKTRISELVDADVDAALNLLRCYTNLIFDRGARAYIGLRGTVFRAARPSFIFTSEENEWLTNVQATGMLFPFQLDSKKLQHLKTHCAFDIVSEILSKPDNSRTELESIIITTVRWLGRGIVATDSPEKVLALSVALERLLTTDKEEHSDITDRLARRLALLLSDDPASRVSLYKRAKQLYGLRSDVVHAGRIEIEESDVRQIEALACNAMIKMAQRLAEWKNHGDFTSWAERITFGGS